MTQATRQNMPVAQAQAPVKRRKVYYIAGFDPRGAGFYHRLYREESAKQSTHLGTDVRVGSRAKRAPHVSAWNVHSQWDDHAVQTEYQYLHWDDLVRRHWEPNRLKLVWLSLATYTGYAACGALGRLRKTFKGPFYSSMYPLLFLALVLLLAAGLGAVTRVLLEGLTGSGAIGWASGLAAGFAMAWGGMALGNRLAVFWLLQIYRFVQGWGVREPDGVMDRIDALADWIVQEQRACPDDEVLLVGHSVGSIVAVSVAARLIDALPPAQRSHITLVTLGQCIPLLSLMPSAKAFHADLRRLSDDCDMQWLDMNARADSLCFSQANPLDISGIAGASVGRPTAQVVRPFRMFDKQAYARMKRSKQRLHFQYMMASALPNEYDYFRMTAGPSRIQPF